MKPTVQNPASEAAVDCFPRMQTMPQKWLLPPMLQKLRDEPSDFVIAFFVTPHEHWLATNGTRDNCRLNA